MLTHLFPRQQTFSFLISWHFWPQQKQFSRVSGVGVGCKKSLLCFDWFSFASLRKIQLREKLTLHDVDNLCIFSTDVCGCHFPNLNIYKDCINCFLPSKSWNIMLFELRLLWTITDFQGFRNCNTHHTHPAEIACLHDQHGVASAYLQTQVFDADEA